MADSSVMPIADPPPQNSELVIPDSLIDNIDFNEGRVFFNEQVFLKNDATIPPFLPTEAWLRLRCSFPIRDPVTMAMVTAQYWYNPSNPAEVQVTKAIKNSEVFLEYINDTVATSNLLSFLSAAQSQLAAEIGQYSSGVGVSAPYQTWVFDIPPDGIVRAVAWDHTEAGEATTHIDYNYERPSYYDTLNERRLKRLFTYNSVLNLELARKQKRGVTQVRFGGNKP
jgi:hypothetical protein